MKKFFGNIWQGTKGVVQALTPPPVWQPVAIILLGGFIGLAGYTYHISNASSYLSDDPRTCINCHVMIPQYSSWRRSSHANVATCVDCHVPHDNIVHKYQFKIKDGMRHSKIFMLRQEPQVIRIKEDGRVVVQQNCISCHQSFLDDVAAAQVSSHGAEAGEGKLCWECHRDVPHGQIRSLSSTPYALTPELSGDTPQWMEGVVPFIENIMYPKKQQGEGP